MRGIAALEVNHDHQMPLSGMSGQASLFEKKRAVQRPEGQPDEGVRLQPLPLGDETAKSMNTAIR